MTFEDFKNTPLPDEPGVYRFVDQDGIILYIGRATSLRDRVRSYFSNDLIKERGVHFGDMVTRTHHVEWTQTNSVLEAIILEANIIKKLQPYYNTKEKDDKSYYVIVITDEEFPRVFLERERVLEQQEGEFRIKESFGPFPNGQLIKEALRILRKTFPFISGKTKNQSRDRFYQMLGLQSTQEQEKYNQIIEDLITVLRGDLGSLLVSLSERMNEASKKEQFEEALQYRNMIWSLKHIKDITLIKSEKSYDIDTVRIEAYDISHLEGKSMVGVMVVLENGEPQKSEYRKFHIRGIESANDPLALFQVLTRRMKHKEWKMPNILVCDGNAIQMNVADSVLAEYKIPASVVSVVKDDRHKAREVLGDARIIDKYKEAIIYANQESHRYALSFHKQARSSAFINNGSKNSKNKKSSS